MDDVCVWAIDISAWNRAPYTRIDAQHAPRPPIPRFYEDLALLDENASRKVQQYMRAIDRIRSLVARFLPRVMLVDVMGMQPRDVRIHTEHSGRPYADAGVDFNLSHDSDWVVMAFSRTHRVGVDVMETSLPHFEESSASFCHTMEMAMTAEERSWVLHGRTDAAVLSRLYDVWTYKEALTKNMGFGLGFDFSRIQMEFWHAEPQLRVDGAVDTRYRFREVALHTNERAARVAVALGPHTWTEPMQKCGVPAADAVAHGWLRVWTYDAFMDHARASLGV